MQSDWVIPLPPDAEASAARGDTKRAIGLYPCINNGHCSEFILIKLDAKGFPYGACSSDQITFRGCKKRSVKGAPEDIPPQTFEAYQAALERVQGLVPIRECYTRYLENRWNEYNERGGDHADERP